MVIAQPLLDERFLFGGEADLFGAAPGIGDGQDPDGMTGAFGAGGAAGAMTDVAVEQGAAEDLGGGEGREAASLARASGISSCFILINENTGMVSLSMPREVAAD